MAYPRILVHVYGEHSRNVLVEDVMNTVIANEQRRQTIRIKRCSIPL
ncbi:MAG: hypothetical protein WCB79_08660 [Halobacteriota archaeon]